MVHTPPQPTEEHEQQTPLPHSILTPPPIPSHLLPPPPPKPVLNYADVPIPGRGTLRVIPDSNNTDGCSWYELKVRTELGGLIEPVPTHRPRYSQLVQQLTGLTIHERKRGTTE